MFEFEEKNKCFGYYRADFANRICKMLYKQCDGDIDKAIIEGKDIFDDLNEHVRNIYELVGRYIPLMAYYELMEYGADNYGFSDSEYEEALMKARKACKEYYE